MARRKTDKPIQVPLTPEQYTALENEAKARNLTINQLIRELLSAHVPDFPIDSRRSYVPSGD